MAVQKKQGFVAWFVLSGEGNNCGFGCREFELPFSTPFGHFVDIGLEDGFQVTSSANRRRLVFAGGDRKSWSMMLKSSGLTTATWGTPLSIFLEFDAWPPSRLAMDRSQRKVESQPRQFP